MENEQQNKNLVSDFDVELSINPLLMMLVVSVYDDTGSLVAQANIAPSQTEKLMRSLYPRAILSESELVDMIQKAYNYFH